MRAVRGSPRGGSGCAVDRSRSPSGASGISLNQLPDPAIRRRVFFCFRSCRLVPLTGEVDPSGSPRNPFEFRNEVEVGVPTEKGEFVVTNRCGYPHVVFRKRCAGLLQQPPEHRIPIGERFRLRVHRREPPKSRLCPGSHPFLRIYRGQIPPDGGVNFVHSIALTGHDPE
jgi:hypothetical protein